MAGDSCCNCAILVIYIPVTTLREKKIIMENTDDSKGVLQ